MRRCLVVQAHAYNTNYNNTGNNPTMNMQPVGNESPRSVAHNFKPSAVSVWPIALGLCERDLHCISSRTLSRAEVAKKKHLEKLKEARARKNSINQPWM